MPDRLHALAFNELTRALSDVDRFVALTEREEITRRLVPLILREAASEAAQVDMLAHQFTARWLRNRADEVERNAAARAVSERKDTTMREAHDAWAARQGFGGGGQEC